MSGFSEEELQELEGDCEVELGNRDNVFAEYCLEIVAEARRLNEKRENEHKKWDEIEQLYIREEKRLKEQNKALRRDRDNIARTADFKTNQRYKQALEFYAYVDNWRGGLSYHSPVDRDRGSKAQKALGSGDNE